MTTTVNCDTCDHRIVCQFAAEAGELKKRIQEDLPPAVQGDNILPALQPAI